MRHALNAIPFALVATIVVAAPNTKLSPEIASIETGIICPPEPVGTRPAPGTVAGTTNVIGDEPPFVSNSHRVPAVLGIGFGAKSLSESAFGLDNVTMVVTHPPMGDGAVESQNFLTSISGADPSLTFYQFDYDYELLIGTWRMTAMHKGEVLYTTSFEVVPPSQVPELASVCGYEALLS
ncbi:DUF3859 domain-containing protein [Yoonia sp. 2307UL14-13]|uniref:DUF3859 domain-containing protein n=1 Tax=Yoonia sp. 2307UL14-13 TaxID=3126506 RepID=UPI0030B4308B